MTRLILVIILLMPMYCKAAERAVSPAVTLTAAAMADYDSSKYPFGVVAASGTTVCVHKNTSMITMQDLSPIDLQGRWHFKIKHKDRPSEVLDVTGMIEYTKVINNEIYYFYGVPLENKGNLIRFANGSAFIRNLKYPVFSFIFLDVELDPQIRYIDYPLKKGDSWKVDSQGVVDVFGLFKIKMKTNAQFKVLSVEDVVVDGRVLHVFKIENLVERGNDGKIFREQDWFAAGVGLMYQDTEAYTLELEKYTPGPDNLERFNKLTVPLAGHI